ncbi:hypothetical protein [Riemerella columbipharyngis]|uniref:Uncharacterized protein n=1 Tax=Riemerella columbipharyngis TaxID=1071918 RepID=A0A1G6ZCF6_9FLAO|nr:hypothetical protein [Riemerella columbipharyngis]SDD99993.1 hypothetical protein SAMN05421544_10231 [Riemerella columbipharyngis]
MNKYQVKKDMDYNNEKETEKKGIKERVINKLNENPKKFFKISFIILCVLSMISITKDLLIPNKEQKNGITLPLMYNSSSDNEMKKSFKDFENSKQANEIIEELKFLKEKRKAGAFTKEDSLRVDYLISQLKNIK